MQFRLYYRPGSTWPDAPENEGFDIYHIQGLLRALAQKGHTYDVIDTTSLTSDELMDYYIREAATPAVYKKYRVRQVFGSKRHPGWQFGNGVAALAVHEGSQCGDVYPHEDAPGRVITIRQYLEQLATQS